MELSVDQMRADLEQSDMDSALPPASWGDMRHHIFYGALYHFCVLALNKNPDQYEKLLQNPGLIPKMVPEIIRWQTPLAHMARTANQDTELRGKQIKKGDRVVMWYISGNRDEDYIENADKFIIDRPNPRAHTAFGYGIHRCVGNRLAEMQLKVMWEEINKRFSKVEVTGDPLLVNSNFVHGIRDLPVTLRD
jgi:cytochrome P450